MIPVSSHPSLRRGVAFALFTSAISCVALLLSGPPAAGENGLLSAAAAVDGTGRIEPAEVAAFRQSVGGSITPLVIELKGEPGVLRKVAAEREGNTMAVAEIAAHATTLTSQQDSFIAQLSQRGVRALPRETIVPQLDGSTRHIKYRFTYLLNGFVAYVATEDIPRLRAMPEVAYVSEAMSPTYHLDKAIDYSLATDTDFDASDRRTKVYGATQEFEPADPNDGAHPEAPKTSTTDGFEGQNMRIAVIDTGVDWRHPMFGGIGQTTPQPRVSGQPESAADNKKVIYYYALSSPGDITDDFGHGTHVASCAAGYSVDGNTAPRTGYGLGVNPPLGVGPTPGGVQLFGTAPQAQIMAYKVCGPANACPGDIELAIEDAASPYTLVASGDTGPDPVAKPIADVINLSLGDTSGDPAGSTSRASNNAALAGTIVVTSAGNSGPGLGTTGSPGTATLAIAVAANLDPGSLAAADVLQANQVPTDTRLDNSAGPPPETGAESESNLAEPDERQGIKLFPVAGGGSIPEGSMSAHYVYVEDPNSTPPEVRNRIALVRGGSGTFFNIVNAVAVQMPAAIIITDDRESLTALVVAGGIPVFNVNTETSDYLMNLISDTDNDGEDDDKVDDVPVGAISKFPLRLGESFSPASFPPGMAGFSSRGPNDHPNARFRTVKPDVTAPGVGILGAATVEGTPEETVGMASTTGYIKANGTSFASPITAGAIALVRQYVRNTLGLDETDSADDQQKVNWRERRFDTVTVSRALLMNSATNLRTAAGVPQGDGPASTASVNEMGAGLINVAAALQGKAIMVAPEELLTTPSEYTPEPTPEPSASPSPSPTPFTVLIPSVSFGPVPVIGVNGTVTRSREVIIRDVAAGAGSGVYTLTLQNNRNVDSAAFQVSFTDAQGAAINSVSVPSGGQASFFVRTVADGNTIITDPTEFQWYVTATAQSGQTLRMPFYYRAVEAVVPNVTAPEQEPIEETTAPSPTPAPPTDCSTFDTDGNYTVRWNYPQPEEGPTPQGFRVQEATRINELFFDDADEPLVNGDNSKWTGTDQWNSSVNPETNSLAYYVPDAADQDESITMVEAKVVPAGGATLSFDTTQDTEEGFDYAHVELTTDGTNFVTVASFTGFFAGTRILDISGYAGQSVKIRFRMVSDLVVAAPGWWVENIRITSDNFRTIGNLDPATTSLGISGRFDGTYYYRIAGLFDNPVEGEPIVTGPYSNVRCVMVTDNPAPAPSRGALRFGAATYSVGENGGTVTINVIREGGSAGEVTVDYATSDNTATAGEDYTAAAGTLTFPEGVNDAEFTIEITNDAAAEPDEIVNLTLSNADGGATLGTVPAATLTILDDDTASGSPGTLQFSAASYSEAEDAGNATITVTRTGGSTGAVSVSYATSDGSAIANSDYTPASGTLNFAEGELTKTFNVPLIDDPSAEPDENLNLTLSNASGGATLGTPASATLTIVDTDRAGPPAQLLNISTRVRVRSGDLAAIGGFIVTGNGDKRIIARGIGPSLTSNGQPLGGRLEDPVLELFDGNGVLITSNDNWKESPEQSEIQSSGLAPSNDAEAAIARTVQPGAYTAVLYGKDQTEGIGLVEVYDRDQGGASEMANISTRGFVDTGDNVLIGGFIAGARSGATNVVVRAIGPSLSAQEVPDALQDPVVQLFDANGQQVDTSDNWKTSGDEAEVTARGLAPQDDRESAVFETVPPGNYTAVVRGAGDTTGVGLVEIYNVQ